MKLISPRIDPITGRWTTEERNYMKTQIFSVYDNAVGAFNQPFFSRSIGEAKRAFIKACATGQLKETALDCVLFHIGEFYDDNGAILPHDAPVKLMTGVEGKKTGEQERAET